MGRVLASLGYTRNPVLRSQVVWLSPLLSNNVFIHILRAAHRVHRAGELPPDPGTPLAPTPDAQPPTGTLRAYQLRRGRGDGIALRGVVPRSLAAAATGDGVLATHDAARAWWRGTAALGEQR